jgi:hypothetical protein
MKTMLGRAGEGVADETGAALSRTARPDAKTVAVVRFMRVVVSSRGLR